MLHLIVLTRISVVHIVCLALRENMVQELTTWEIKQHIWRDGNEFLRDISLVEEVTRLRARNQTTNN